MHYVLFRSNFVHYLLARYSSSTGQVQFIFYVKGAHLFAVVASCSVLVRFSTNTHARAHLLTTIFRVTIEQSRVLHLFSFTISFSLCLMPECQNKSSCREEITTFLSSLAEYFLSREVSHALPSILSCFAFWF